MNKDRRARTVGRSRPSSSGGVDGRTGVDGGEMRDGVRIRRLGWNEILPSPDDVARRRTPSLLGQEAATSRRQVADDAGQASRTQARRSAGTSENGGGRLRWVRE